MTKADVMALSEIFSDLPLKKERAYFIVNRMNDTFGGYEWVAHQLRPNSFYYVVQAAVDCGAEGMSDEICEDG